MSGEVVSIVITCYNQGRFLSQAIDSALNQTHAEPEIIVVDDGSTDDTAAVARAFEKIRYIYQPNQGVSVARNAGIHESRGAFLTFLDADDHLLPDALSAGLACFRAYPTSGFVVGRYRKIAADGSPTTGPNSPSGAQDFYRALLLSNVIGMHAAVLYRRDALEQVGGFEQRFKWSEDYDMALRIARTFSVVEHDNLIAEYRWHDRNMSLDYRSMLQDSLAALHAQWPYIKHKPELKPIYKAGVRNWQRHYRLLMTDNLRRQVETSGLSLETIRRSLAVVRCHPQSIATLGRAALRSTLRKIRRPLSSM